MVQSRPGHTPGTAPQHLAHHSMLYVTVWLAKIWARWSLPTSESHLTILSYYPSTWYLPKKLSPSAVPMGMARAPTAVLTLHKSIDCMPVLSPRCLNICGSQAGWCEAVYQPLLFSCQQPSKTPHLLTMAVMYGSFTPCWVVATVQGGKAKVGRKRLADHVHMGLGQETIVPCIPTFTLWVVVSVQTKVRGS